MNKFITKVAKLVLGLSLAAGVGVAVDSQKASRTDAANSTYNKVSLDNISDGDQVLIVSYYNSAAWYYLPSTTTSSAPTAVSVSISNNSIVADLDSYMFTVGGTGSSRTFSNGTNYLVNTNNNNGVRINTTSSSSWTVTATTNGYKMTNNSRWLGVYNGSDWRSYTTSNASNYKNSGEYINFYKKAATKTLSSIVVKTAPTKTTYYAGEYFNPSGLELTATYSDSSTATIDYATYSGDFTFTPSTSTALTTSDVSVTIGYGGKTTTQAITVNAARTLSSISVSGYTSTFDQGDTFAFGGTVTAHYSNSTTENVTASATFSGYNLAETGNQTVTVSYTEGGTTKTTTYSITVNAVSSVTFVAGTDKSDTLSLTKKGVTISLSGGTLSRDDNYRVYANNSLTISSTIGKIKSISLALVSGNHGDYSSSYNNVNSTSWTESTTTQARITQIDVEIMPSTPAIELDKNSLDLKTNESSGKTVKATIYNVDNPTIVWTPNNENVTIETGSIVDGEQTATIKPNINAAANTTITVTVTGTSLSATISVSITVPGPGESAGTAFTVSQARTHIDSVITGGESSGNDGSYYYAAGIVSAIVTPYDSTYHNISYTISADGLTSGAQLEAYRGKGLNGANFTSDDDIAVGDQVVIYGQLKKYNDTYEFDADNYLVSRVAAPQVHSIIFTPSVVEVAPDDAGDIIDLFTNIVIDQDTGANKTTSDIVWSSGDANVFYVDGDEYLVAGAHKDSTTLYASIGGKQLGSATIEVVDPDHPFIVYDVPTSYTKITSTTGWVDGEYLIVYEDGADSLVFDGDSFVDAKGNTVEATISNGVLDPTAAVNGATVWITSTNDGYTIQSHDKTKYITGKNSNNNGCTIGTTASYNSLVFDTEDTETVALFKDGSNNVLRYNSTDGWFRFYKSSTYTGQKAVQLYRKTGGGTDTIDLGNDILTAVHAVMANYQDEHGDTQYGLAICNYYGGSNLTNWSTSVAAQFSASLISTYKLNYARANRAGNDVEKFLSAYDYVVENYGSSYDFLGRIATGKVTPIGEARIISNFITDSSNTVAIIVVISMVSVTAIGGYFFLKRREQN